MCPLYPYARYLLYIVLFMYINLAFCFQVLYTPVTHRPYIIFYPVSLSFLYLKVSGSLFISLSAYFIMNPTVFWSVCNFSSCPFFCTSNLFSEGRFSRCHDGPSCAAGSRATPPAGSPQSHDEGNLAEKEFPGPHLAMRWRFLQCAQGSCQRTEQGRIAMAALLRIPIQFSILMVRIRKFLQKPSKDF